MARFAEDAQAAEQVEGLLEVLHHRAFGDFQLQVAGLQPGLFQGVGDPFL